MWDFFDAEAARREQLKELEAQMPTSISQAWNTELLQAEWHISVL